MREFFKGWRRKIGVVTLMMGSIFAMGWVRSLSYYDQVALPEFDSQRSSCLQSLNGSFRWIRIDSLSSSDVWLAIPSRDNVVKSIVPDESPGVHWRFRFLGFGVGVFGQANAKISMPSNLYCCSYSTLVIPLTAISAYLLLSKSRQSTPKKTAQPITSEGGAAA